MSNNSGSDNGIFYIEGESSLVINGFDLTPLGLELPAALDTVSISVSAPAPGSSIDLVVYQDANGGSPVDATLVYRQTVSLERTGVNRIALEQAAIITEPVVWVGFYLPVDFRFHADRSGPSVLTYWAWTPASTFDLASLSSAAVLGPGDGSEPVGIAMDGIARITAEMRTAKHDEIGVALPLGQQFVAEVGQDTSIMQAYENCDLVLYDPEDNSISADLSFPLDCRIAPEFEAPTAWANPPDQILDMQRAGNLYKIETTLREDQHVWGRPSQLPVRVTHCMRIAPGDLERAVIGEVRESEQWGEQWHVLPSVRFNDIVCAEVSVANYLSYFLPRTAESPPNVNLTLGWTRVNPHPLECGMEARLSIPVVNTGQSWFETNSGDILIVIEDFHVATSIPTTKLEMPINTDHFGPGVRRVIEAGPIYVESFAEDLHRLEVRVDARNEIAETNELDNSWSTEYILAFPAGLEECFDRFAPVEEEEEEE
ncbi:MAG: hypothetical protein F4X87_02470, partial [Chloroflexi bacterium]|nr:hypothetical protein [Chloroflexota bacterium]